MWSCHPVQYTDAGVYTCSQGGRPYKIPGSYGRVSALVYLGSDLTSLHCMQVTTARTPRHMLHGELSVSPFTTAAAV